MDHILQGFLMALTPYNIIYLLLGCVVGLIVGVLPGLGPIFGVALFLPLTFSLPVDTSLILLTAIYAATAYGDGITSILLNVPGGPSGVAITFDGYPLAQQGKAGMAMGALACSALVGDMLGVLALATIAPLLANFALKIGPAEYFLLTIFGLSMVSMIGKGKGQVFKGLVLGCFGLAISFVGRDVITGVTRYNFGFMYLEDGIPFISACIGLFALSQIFIMAEKGDMRITGENALVTQPWEGVKATFKNWFATVRGAGVGIFMSMIPGIGITTASLMAYLVQERTARDRETYGKGNICGVIAPQAAANATTGGELIPALSLGIPSGPTSAIFIAALTLHGLRPGLQFFTSGGNEAYSLFAGMFLAAIVFFIIGITCTPLFARVTKIPNALLVPIIGILCFAGSFALRNMLEDLIVTVIFGVIGYFLFKYDWPIACMILGLILGPLAESNFQRAMTISEGSYGIFLGSPVAVAMMSVIVAMVAWTFLGDSFKKMRSKMRDKG
ncbi:MAG: tripartite tricarboxylate transporter permease [Deltaproteobacteria bacterium]